MSNDERRNAIRSDAAHRGWVKHFQDGIQKGKTDTEKDFIDSLIIIRVMLKELGVVGTKERLQTIVEGLYPEPN